LKHITNQTSYIITNKKNCANEAVISNINFSTTSKVDSTKNFKSLKIITKKLRMHTHLKFEIKHVIEYKDKLKDFPIYECVACERLWFESQTFHLTKTRLKI
jgi:hypothetical protein